MSTLWRIVHDVEGAPRVMIAQGWALIHARLRASIAGFGGRFAEATRVDEQCLTPSIAQLQIADESVGLVAREKP